jgi:hypothetical protein
MNMKEDESRPPNFATHWTDAGYTKLPAFAITIGNGPPRCVRQDA